VRKNAAAVQDEVIRTALNDGFGVRILIEEEKGGSGKSVIEAYKRLLVGYTVDAAKAEGVKESRATPYSAEQHKKRVFLPRPGSVSWDVKAFIDEHKRMMGDGRRPKHDDQIDTAAYAILALLSHGTVEMWIPGSGTWASPERQMQILLGKASFA
jgi:phage terminase large subunit-like protein